MFSSLTKKFKGPTINDLVKAYNNTKSLNTASNPTLRNIKNANLRRLENNIKKMVNTKQKKKGGTLGNRQNVQKIIKNRSANAGRCNTLRLQKQQGFRLSYKNKTFLAGCAVGAGAKHYGAQARNQLRKPLVLPLVVSLREE